MRNTKSDEQIRAHKDALLNQRGYLNAFLTNSIKGSNVKQQVLKELQILDKEIETLQWVLNDTLPF